MAHAHWSTLPGSTQTCSVALRPERVTNESSSLSSFAATIAKRYEGFGNGSSHFTRCRPPASLPRPTGFPFESSTGYFSRSAWIVVV